MPLLALTYSKWPLLQDIILAAVRTGACFPVTNVPSVASTVVGANIIAALRVHMTKRWRNGALVNVWLYNNKELKWIMSQTDSSS